MKTLSLTLVGQIKSGKNNMQVTRTGRHFPKPEWAYWRDATVCLCLGQNISKVRFSEPAGVFVRYWSSDRRRRDVPGMADAICHVLERANIVSDDSLLVDWTWIFMGLDRNNPRAEIVIEEMEATK